jgi:Lar family restriction alleviation protein
MKQLKPCPFCGGDGMLYDTSQFGLFIAWCNNCGVDTDPYDTREEAIAAWNQRTHDKKHLFKMWKEMSTYMITGNIAMAEEIWNHLPRADKIELTKTFIKWYNQNKQDDETTSSN